MFSRSCEPRVSGVGSSMSLCGQPSIKKLNEKRDVRWAMLAVAMLAAASCGGGGDDGKEPQGKVQQALPRPPAGRATIGGKFVRDGRPVPRGRVSLSTRLGEGKVVANTKTDQRGNFLFRAIRPGIYFLQPTFTVRAKDLRKRISSCTISPPFQSPVLVAEAHDKRGKLQGLIVTALLGHRVSVNAGDRVIKTIAFTCE